MKSVLILIENFYPAYKGGGPIQSVSNLILSLEDEYKVYVITRAFDMQSTEMLPNIKPDTWNDILLPKGKKTVRVWYSKKNKHEYSTFSKIIKEIQPHFIYMNGIFSYNLFLIPLIALRKDHDRKIIICPRGMLQSGALADKSLKKKIYLQVLKSTGLVNKVVWHATNTEEKEDILKHFGENNKVVIAMNIPKKPVENVSRIEKLPGNLKLVYISLITEKKNLLFLLELLKQTVDITLDIYGPVKDNAYWNHCIQLISKMPKKVKYLGSIMPSQVQDTFAEYHASILLTKGENFGHALYESLSVARPIITSNFTPWNNLEQHKAGWNLDISDLEQCIAQLNKIKEIDHSEYSAFSNGAYKLAGEYFKRSNNLDDYKILFSV